MTTFAGAPVAPHDQTATAPRVVEMDAAGLIGHDRFHDAFQTTFGFPAHYGRNMDAWIDCMSDLRDGATGFALSPAATLTLRLRNHDRLRDTAPLQWRDLMECAAFVNQRELDRGHAPLLAFAF